VLESAAEARGTNLIRDLCLMAGNDLTCKSYVKLVQTRAKKLGLKTRFYDFQTLRTKGAGAFCAVAQGSSHKDAGILEITYTPTGRSPMQHLALVGKGITYDTGGVNVKPAAGMFGMHMDMAGSAAA